MRCYQLTPNLLEKTKSNLWTKYLQRAHSESGLIPLLKNPTLGSTLFSRGSLPELPGHMLGHPLQSLGCPHTPTLWVPALLWGCLQGQWWAFASWVPRCLWPGSLCLESLIPVPWLCTWALPHFLTRLTPAQEQGRVPEDFSAHNCLLKSHWFGASYLTSPKINCLKKNAKYHITGPLWILKIC